jgi:fido (protein-threonine AMPylation protein)
MLLIPTDNIEIQQSVLDDIDNKSKSIYRAITFCKKTSSKSLLDSFVNSTNSLTELLSIKNAQMEAETEEEIEVYQRNLNKTILFVVNEIKNGISINSQVQLFQIFRLISPESHKLHPNQYRRSLVQIGRYICPNPERLNGLVTQLFSNLESISHPLVKAIYLHHELIRIHPFIDGNGRTTRIAKNWILMYNLYPPIFIKDEFEKKEYINTLSKSFSSLEKNNSCWNQDTNQFFQQELNRVSQSIEFILNEIKIETNKIKKG